MVSLTQSLGKHQLSEKSSSPLHHTMVSFTQLDIVSSKLYFCLLIHTSHTYISLLYFLGCTLLFRGEKDTDSLRVFNNSSSLRLNTSPRETCAARETYYVTYQTIQPWKQLKSVRPAFNIRHENRRPGRHAHFLEVCVAGVLACLFYLL